MICNVRQNTIDNLKKKGLVDDNMKMLQMLISYLQWTFSRYLYYILQVIEKTLGKEVLML